MKIYILGGCGSGKTYLSKKLSKIYNIKAHDLDYIAKIPEKGFQKVPNSIRDARLKKLLKNFLTFNNANL